MDVGRKAIDSLSGNVGLADIFAGQGPSSADLQAIAHAEPTYFALGAIGPDLFFLLPDFKPPIGSRLWWLASTVRKFYEALDENFLGPWEDNMGPIMDNANDLASALSGGLLGQLEAILGQLKSTLFDTIAVLAAQQYDLFSLLSSGVPNGFDEQAFFWSDMLHYRQTYRMAVILWQRAGAIADPTLRGRCQAYALGWMSHLGTDVVGHAFVNQKVGGPYRLHWQRHHVVENHMDARVYQSQHGGDALYNQISASALHLWLSFADGGASLFNSFLPQPGPTYAPGDDTPSTLNRHAAWDVDSELPDDLADFLSEALKAGFDLSDTALTADPFGQEACCPTIISEIADRTPIASSGYPLPDDIGNAYWYMVKYLKMITTDFDKLAPPTPPEIIQYAPFPSPPGSGTSDAGPGGGDDFSFGSILDFLLAIFAWVAYIFQVVAWALSLIPSIIAGLLTYPLREFIYNHIQVPLYNAWLALHHYMAMTGYVLPMPAEINAGLTTLGVGPEGTWRGVLDALDALDGGLTGKLGTASENSGADRQRRYPHDVVVDDLASMPLATELASAIGSLLHGTSEAKVPSEFQAPWRFPETNQAGKAVPPEFPLTEASPYKAMTDVLGMLAALPGDAAARAQLEGAKSESQTIDMVRALLKAGQTLGDPTDYVRYLMATLTRNGVVESELANFNLDADRGYGHLTWDWRREAGTRAMPGAFEGTVNDDTGLVDDASQRVYRSPVRPGYGCNPMDQDPDPVGATVYNPTSADDPVNIRYIGRESKT